MSELIAYKDSPLGEYLREIEAAEALVVDEKPAKQVDPVVSRSPPDEHPGAGYWIAKLSTYTLGFWNMPTRDYGRLVFVVLQQSIDMLTEAGLLSERYTPKYKAQTQHYTDTLNEFTVSRRTSILRFAKHLVPPVAIAAMVFKSGVREADAICATVPVAAFGLALFSLRNQKQFSSAVEQSQQYITKLGRLANSCRRMDAAMQRAIKSAQEIEFVGRGFRLPQYTGALNIASRSGQGAMWAAKHARQTVDEMLSETIDVLQELLGGQLAGSPELDELVDLACDEVPGGCSLEHLRRKFAVHFSLRRIWLGSILESIDSVMATGTRADHKSIDTCLSEAVVHVERYMEAADRTVEALRRVRESQYTAKRWESLAGASSLKNTGALARSLVDMGNVLDTIQAKLCVCRDFVDQVDDTGAVFSEDAARIFASLKPDIDVLNSRYQQAVTLLTCPETDGEERTPLFMDGVQEDSEAFGDDLDVFGCTPMQLVELDAPGMVFEAEMDIGQSAGRSKVSKSYW
ncbi:hypothetical protein GGI15_001025 [Coemansia interrupta]|uniref:Myosin-binding domain-containing protein n=1 Tax=Coemansia interrupta TaxID=1126814 RepID=A0A9W8HM13_9FUNG|nr:hypothetical protein GGI15_001025 [Coemansia interrupta]